MLAYKLTPHHAGIALWGDFSTLHRLHTFVHHVVNNSCFISEKDGLMLGLAYDLRKAFQGQRSTEHQTVFDNERYQTYGVEILWPVLLIQICILRKAMAYMACSKLDQAIMFELEHVVESAIREAIPAKAGTVIHHLQLLQGESYTSLDRTLDSRCRYFIELPAPKRLRQLPELLETFMFDDNNTSSRRRRSIPQNAFIESNLPWPDFEW